MPALRDRRRCRPQAASRGRPRRDRPRCAWQNSITAAWLAISSATHSASLGDAGIARRAPQLRHQRARPRSSRREHVRGRRNRAGGCACSLAGKDDVGAHGPRSEGPEPTYLIRPRSASRGSDNRHVISGLATFGVADRHRSLIVSSPVRWADAGMGRERCAISTAPMRNIAGKTAACRRKRPTRAKMLRLLARKALLRRHSRLWTGFRNARRDCRRSRRSAPSTRKYAAAGRKRDQPRRMARGRRRGKRVSNTMAPNSR